MVFEYRDEPWKTLYLAYDKASLWFRYPLWALYFLAKRPRPSWSFDRSLTLAYKRHLSEVEKM